MKTIIVELDSRVFDVILMGCETMDDVFAVLNAVKIAIKKKEKEENDHYE